MTMHDLGDVFQHAFHHERSPRASAAEVATFCGMVAAALLVTWFTTGHALLMAMR